MILKDVRHDPAEVRAFCCKLAMPLWEQGYRVVWEDYRDDTGGVVGTRLRIQDEQWVTWVTISDAVVLLARSQEALIDHFAAHIRRQFEEAKVAA